MSTAHGLICRTHQPHLSTSLDGFQNEYGQRKLSDLWRFRDVLVPAVRVFNGERIDHREHARLIGSVGDQYESNALDWIAVHRDCDVAIITEYNETIEFGLDVLE